MLTVTGSLGAIIIVIGPVLIGMNAAIVYRFWPEPWLVTKLAAVTGLIIFVLFSIAFTTPTEWLVAFGLVVLLGDIKALTVLATALRSARAGDGVLIAYRRR